MRHPALRVLLGVLILSVFLTPFRRELFVGDETKYSQVVREMRSGGSFFLPTLEGSPFTHKPPLHFWLIALLTYPFGVYSLWPYVLPSLAAFLLLLWLVNRIGDDGGVAAFCCGTAVMVWASAQTARMDVSFTALLVLGGWMLLRFFEQRDFRALLHAAIALGVATVVKGPMAPVIGIALFALEAIRRRGAPRGNYLPAIAALIAIPLLWLVPALLIGGEAYANEILYKQTVRRAVGAWVHKSPPWYYVTHAPGTLFPWFFFVVPALVYAWRRGTRDDRTRFYASWILAVLIPYSVISSKLDIYMMAMIPPAALLVAAFVTRELPDGYVRWSRILNVVQLALLAVAGVAGATIASRWVKPPDDVLARLPEVRGLFIVLAAAAIVAIIVVLRARTLAGAALAVGAVPLVTMLYLAIVLVPLANEQASTRPVVDALVREHVPPEQIALYSIPHLWTRTMPRELERAKHVDAGELAHTDATVVVTSRKHDDDIAPALARYRKVGELRMIGKWFDVYRR